MAIDLYFMSASPPARAVLMTVKQLGLTVNIKSVDLSKGEHLTPEYLKLNPTHTVPVLVDGEHSLWESRAIMQYLCNQYAPNFTLYPKDPKERSLVDRWLNTDLTYFLALKDALVMKLITGVEPSEQSIQNFKNNLKTLDTLIGNQKYLAGKHLTIADLSVLATTTLLWINDFQDLNDCPNLKQWYEGLKQELPYFEEVNGQVGHDFKQLKEAMAKHHK